MDVDFTHCNLNLMRLMANIRLNLNGPDSVVVRTHGPAIVADTSRSVCVIIMKRQVRRDKILAFIRLLLMNLAHKRYATCSSRSTVRDCAGMTITSRPYVCL